MIKGENPSFNALEQLVYEEFVEVRMSYMLYSVLVTSDLILGHGPEFRSVFVFFL